jgi:AraC-like DNA-binding protein
MDADMDIVLQSDFYRIVDFRCRCAACAPSAEEYADAFSISFIRQGNFIFHVYRSDLDCHSGRILVSKPGYPRRVSHVHAIPDACTVFEFSDGFYREMQDRYSSGILCNNDMHSAVVKATARAERLGDLAAASGPAAGRSRLQADELALSMAGTVLDLLTGTSPDRVDGRLKRNHLGTVESAKSYIRSHFSEDISLAGIAAHCHVSPFHFARVFRAFTSTSPHRYLSEIRLEHARMLLRDTSRTVSAVAFSSGFRSVEHFTFAFRKAFGCSPGKFRDCR